MQVRAPDGPWTSTWPVTASPAVFPVTETEDCPPCSTSEIAVIPVPDSVRRRSTSIQGRDRPGSDATERPIDARKRVSSPSRRTAYRVPGSRYAARRPSPGASFTLARAPLRLVSAITSPVTRSVTMRKPEPVTAPFTRAEATATSAVAANDVHP